MTELTILNNILGLLLHPVQEKFIFFCQPFLQGLLFLRIFTLK
jgi:hypothetical protein